VDFNREQLDIKRKVAAKLGPSILLRLNISAKDSSSLVSVGSPDGTETADGYELVRLGEDGSPNNAV
jgi:hypothetical protein